MFQVNMEKAAAQESERDPSCKEVFDEVKSSGSNDSYCSGLSHAINCPDFQSKFGFF